MIHPSRFKEDLARLVANACRQVAGTEAASERYDILETPRQAAHGDYSSSAALMLARRLGDKPRDVAERILSCVESPDFVADIQIAEPGFINITIKNTAKVKIVREVLMAGNDYGRLPAKKETILVEFISANPTGPLHVGHGRACAYGDALAEILMFTGSEVRREYYVNDAGRQMSVLAASVWLRYWHRNGFPAMPTGSYQGDYLPEVAEKTADILKQSAPASKELFLDLAALPDASEQLMDAAQNAFPSELFKEFSARVCDIMLKTVIKEDIRRMGIDVDKINFFYESELHKKRRIDDALKRLRENGCLEEKSGAWWFKSTAYGDDKDRVVRRTNGEPTYFAADIAYHLDKLSRPHSAGHAYQLLNILGADHHGYVPRLRAVLSALGVSPDRLEAQLIQFVALVNAGERLKMSTRAGAFVALRDLVDNVGRNAARYFYVSRKNDQRLDFDLAVAQKQDSNNPIYYIQYANARICSVMKKWEGDEKQLKDVFPAGLDEDWAAVRLCEKLAAYTDTLTRAAAERAPHLLAVYLYELAALLHTYYEKTRILPAAGAPINDDTLGRLALLAAVRQVLVGGSGLLGLRLKEVM